ncbi:uncharacterized protein N7477_002641 [Penicillium maclennaniae]|uniref:uncharacterized protein n=1 Tax=Penicillium maclennaniae TaxID=1343394 RepID=UPI00254120A0|nr:uncharacterized protein N7477_002641 [Penicillium maclennaniae]KAJ5677008.1 hypothetical protein N7477_002641 [Penicillium maclennaniae]
MGPPLHCFIFLHLPLSTNKLSQEIMRISSKRSSSEGHGRRRRAHTKSRRGCRNCKLRRVKCDEGSPECQKCQAFGVNCDYSSPNTSDLQPTWQATPSQLNIEDACNQLDCRVKPVPSIRNPIIMIGEGYGSFQLDSDSLARLDRFQHRTAFTFATGRVRELYQNDVIRIALALRLIIGPKELRCLIRKLTRPILPQDRDALWAAAALLGIASVTSIEASNPREAWPLKSYDPNDLD